MKVEVKSYNDWPIVAKAAGRPITQSEVEKSQIRPDWKKQMLVAERPEIKMLLTAINLTDVPTEVIQDINRFGEDILVYRTGEFKRIKTVEELKPHFLIESITVVADAKSLIEMSRSLLCEMRVAPQTVAAWNSIKAEIAKSEPELASCMVADCLYRGKCPEMKGCGYFHGEKYLDTFLSDLVEYRMGWYGTDFKVDGNKTGIENNIDIHSELSQSAGEAEADARTRESCMELDAGDDSAEGISE